MQKEKILAQAVMSSGLRTILKVLLALFGIVSFFLFLMGFFVDDALLFLFFFPFFPVTVILAIIMRFFSGSTSLTISETKVYGWALGRFMLPVRFFIPIEKIDSIEYGWSIGGKTIIVSSANGTFIVFCVKNYDEIVSALMNRIEKINYPTAQETAINIELLKLNKELLEAGAISPEEFEAKKKQVLGL